jgi:hypothetical protein
MRQGRHNKFFRSTFEEPHSIFTKHTTSYDAAMLHPTQGSREVTPSSDKEAPSNITAHYAQEGIRVGNKRRKQRLQGTTTLTHRDNCHG